VTTYASSGLTFDFTYAHLYIDSSNNGMSSWQFYKVYDHTIQPCKYTVIRSIVSTAGKNRIRTLKDHLPTISLDEGDAHISLISQHSNYVTTAFNNRILVRSSFDVLG